MRPLDSGGTGNPHPISSAHSKDSHLLSSPKHSSGVSHRSSSRSTSHGDDRRESRRDTSSHASTKHQAPKPIKIATAKHISSDSATHSSSKSSANLHAEDGRESRRSTYHVSSHKSKGSGGAETRDRHWESGLPDKSKLHTDDGRETRRLSHKETASSQGAGHSRTRERSRESGLPDKSKLHLGNGGEARGPHHKTTTSSQGSSGVGTGSRDRRLESGLPDKSKLHLGHGGETRTLNHNGNSSRQSSSGNVGTRDRHWESGLPDKSKLRLGYGGETRTPKYEGTGGMRSRDHRLESGLPDKSKLRLGYGGSARQSDPSRARSSPSVDHYIIGTKAYIPQSKVVDPSPVGRLIDAPNTFRDPLPVPVSNGLQVDVDTNYQSHYRGDNHTGFDGSWRAQSYIEFDYNGKEITNFKSTNNKDSIAVTHRDWQWNTVAQVQSGPFVISEKEIAHGSGTEAAWGKGTVYGQQKSATSFSLGFSATNDISDRQTPGIHDTPAIDSRLDGSVTEDGKKMTLKYKTDLFPSHGFQVIKNGQVIATEITNNASGVDVSGIYGVANIGYGLTHQNNKGESQIPIG
jgi:hypothetical protein